MSRDSPLPGVPSSLLSTVAAPYTTPLPGSKVRPGPHNIAALAAMQRSMLVNMQAVQASPSSMGAASFPARQQQPQKQKLQSRMPEGMEPLVRNLLCRAWIEMFLSVKPFSFYAVYVHLT